MSNLPPLPKNPAVFDPGRFGVAFSPAQVLAYAEEAVRLEREAKDADAERYRKLRSASDEDQEFWCALAKQEDKDVFLDGGYDAIRARSQEGQG